MREVTLAAAPRPQSGTGPARRMRREGLVPAIIYGLETEPVSVSVSAQEFSHVMHRIGLNALINLDVAGGETQLTMAREIQRHPVRGDLVHVDFVRIRADQPVQAEVAVHLHGEPEGGKEGGVLEHALFTVTVSAKPREIPESFDLDVSELKVGEQKRVGDLRPPEGVEILNDPDAVIANVLVPRVIEEEVFVSMEELAELEGLSEDELAALKELAAAKAEAEAEVEEGTGAEGEGAEAKEGTGAEGEAAAGEGAEGEPSEQ
ncbi:MAG: 50S ribosomal protein L25 [Actinobacteria bacterium]|nr:50S ribosomal protein L25 [Actinomycetota bacterium]